MKTKWVAYVPDVCGGVLFLVGIIKDEPVTTLLGAVVALLGMVSRLDTMVQDLVKFHAFQAAMSKVIADEMEARRETPSE